jgi:PAS domain S-box-containing protein
MRDTAEGTAEGFNFEGGRMFFGFSRSATSGWTVAIGVPKAIMMAEIWHWLRWTIAVTALLSLAGVALALLMARRIAGSIQALIATALALGRGESVVIRHLGLTEFDEAAESLVRASQLIQQRTAERQRAKSARRETGDLKRFNAELERSEAEARALATELAAILDAVPAVTFIARDPECQRITSNRAGYDLLRLPPGANTSRSGSDSEGPMNYRFLRDGRALSPDELPVQLAAAGCEVRDSEYTIAFDDGSSRSVFGNAVPLLDERGRVRGAVGAFIDVTERKHAEKQLQATANRLQAILDNAPVGIVVGTRDYRFVEPNAAFQRMVGYSAEELKQMDREALTHPDDIARNAELVDGLMQGKLKNYELEKRYVLKDGKMIWIRSIGTRLDDEHELSIIEDITERKRTEQVLAESEERLRTIVELAPDGIFVVSNQGQLLAVNQAACKQLGYTRGQLLQLKISDFISPRFAQRVAARLRGQVPDGSYESAHIRADGVEVPVELSVTKILFHGQPAFLGITRDTSDRKRAEEQRKKLEQQLRQAQKMESLGRLAGGIAHDFNNLLMVIQSYTELLEESLPAHDRLRRNTQEIMKAADRAASLTRQMLAFSRKQILSPVVLDLNAVIRETATMLRRLIGEDIDLRVSPAESLWAVEADSDQIAQVLMNLCVNARDAMPQGGTLTIATGNATVAEGGIGGQEYASPGDYVWLSVTDTGAGISKELQGRIFDPFFTTKEVGKGTGLGLATVYGIVKQSGGHVLVDSEVGQGACFTIYLPRVKRAVAAAMPAKAHVQPRRTGMILVAEDEEALREAMCDYLRSLGYTVLGASSGKEALSAVSEHEGHIDLLITDLVMPKMSGRELAQMLGSLRPDLKTIYMSGYTDDEGLRDGIHEQGATFLQKPFSLGTLARKVCETLGQCETVQ